MREGSTNRFFPTHSRSASEDAVEFLFRKILPASRSYSIFYGQMTLSLLPLLKEMNILARSRKNLEDTPSSPRSAFWI